MHTYINVVSGFTQQRYNLFDSGSHDVHQALLSWQSPTTSARLLEWWEDPIGHARRVAATTSPDDIIIVCGYSYGGGYWFYQFSHALCKMGRKIASAVLCDPVFRNSFLFFRIRAMLGHPQVIRIPENVARVTHFVQYMDKPGGESLKFEGEPEYFVTTELSRTHIKMDNAPEYLRACVRETNLLLGSAP